MFVLGIDPGLSRCGYGVIEGRRTGPHAAAIGVITTPPADPLPQRLSELQRELRALIAEYRPQAVAVERVLFQVNVRTAMSVGMASGLAMAEGASAGCEVVQYSPNQIKDAVAGYGGADKEQVQRMVQTLLGLAAVPEPADAADAAAIALTHLAFAGSAPGGAPARSSANGRGGAHIKNAVGRAPRPATPSRLGGAR